VARGNKAPEEIAEEILEKADQDFSFDDLTRGTEVYEEHDEDEEEDDDDPQELNFEPDDSRYSRSPFDDYDDGGDYDY
jgi:hypothetical protein